MLWTKQDPPFIMRLTSRKSAADIHAFEGRHVNQNTGQREVRSSYFFIRAAWIRSKIQIMPEEKRKSASGNFVICDVQEDYAGHLFQILAGQFEGEYQFHLFCDIEKMNAFTEKAQIQVLLIGEEYGEEAVEEIEADNRFVLTGIPGRENAAGSIALFRYQSAESIIKEIRRGIDKKGMGCVLYGRTQSSGKQPGQCVSEQKAEKQRREQIRDEPLIRGLIGVYSPIHRIGKTKFAIRLGQKMAKQIPVLYLNMEGYSGGSYYFQDKVEKDLGDLFYFLREEREDCGLKLAAMTVQKGGMDYILPMKNEQDVRSVSREEWISLLDMIFEKCIYELIILDLGDAIHGLYDILRKCDRIYTPYICEGAAEAKLEQYEENLRTAGYADILRHTVKRQVGRGSRKTEKIGAVQ